MPFRSQSEYYEKIRRQHPDLVSDWESSTGNKFPEDFRDIKGLEPVDVMSIDIQLQNQDGIENGYRRLTERLLSDKKVVEYISVTGGFECDIDISHLDLTRSDFEQGLSDAQKGEMNKLLKKLKLKGKRVETGMIFPVEMECRVPAEYEIEDIL